MTSYKKKFAVSIVALALVFAPVRDSKAIVPIIAAWLLELTGGSILIGDLVAGQAGIISAILWWDCNKFALSAPCTSKTPITATQQPKPAITVSLKPDTKRQNPDPKKFNDPAAGSAKRDVTPKPVIAASGEPAPTTAHGILGMPNTSVDIGVLVQAPRNVNVGAAGVDPGVQQAQFNAALSSRELITGIEIVPQKEPAPPKAVPFVAYMVVCERTEKDRENNKTISCEPAIHAAEQNLLNYSGSKYVRGLVVGKNNNDDIQYYMPTISLFDHATDVTLNCDPGYVDGGRNGLGDYQCNLNDVEKVKKPVDTTCEVLFDPVKKIFMTDKANPACDGLNDSSTLTLSSTDGSKTVQVGMNVGNGFDIDITKQDGSKTGLDTGVYDSVAGGYMIVHVNITPPSSSDNGLGCGGPQQGLCSVQEDGDNPTWIKSNDTGVANRAADTNMKGKMDSIGSNQFEWSFIPSIPTASCKNPSLKSPIGNVTVNMDICIWFTRLNFFINAVLGVLCIYGCVNQIQSAIRD